MQETKNIQIRILEVNLLKFYNLRNTQPQEEPGWAFPEIPLQSQMTMWFYSRREQHLQYLQR